MHIGFLGFSDLVSVYLGGIFVFFLSHISLLPLPVNVFISPQSEQVLAQPCQPPPSLLNCLYWGMKSSYALRKAFTEHSITLTYLALLVYKLRYKVILVSSEADHCSAVCLLFLHKYISMYYVHVPFALVEPLAVTSSNTETPISICAFISMTRQRQLFSLNPPIFSRHHKEKYNSLEAASQPWDLKAAVGEQLAVTFFNQASSLYEQCQQQHYGKESQPCYQLHEME